ncbi:hypothetical protein B0H10DRAFT_1958496 [Mycena sp. CBHHK59/15]|nr:hypothetical protein B0H10DRAFT_1958496 [Mycena sp. CBHHK59/15]
MAMMETKTKTIHLFLSNSKPPSHFSISLMSPLAQLTRLAEQLPPRLADALFQRSYNALCDQEADIRTCPHAEFESRLSEMGEYLNADDIPPADSQHHGWIFDLSFIAAGAVLHILTRSYNSDLPSEHTVTKYMIHSWPRIWRWVQCFEQLSLHCNQPIPDQLQAWRFLSGLFVELGMRRGVGLEPELRDQAWNTACNMIVRHWASVAFDPERRNWPEPLCLTPFNIFFYGYVDAMHDASTRRRWVSENVINNLGTVQFVKAALFRLGREADRMEDLVKEGAHSDPEVTNDDIPVTPAMDVVGLAMFTSPGTIAFTFLAQGVIRSLTRLAVVLTRLPRGCDDVTSAAKTAFASLEYYIPFTDSVAWVIQAFDAGILVAILGSHKLSPQLGASVAEVQHSFPARILSEILPRFFVFLSVVRAARRAVRKVDRSGITSSLPENSKIGAAWRTFLDFLRTRRKVARRASRGQPACDNDECDATEEFGDNQAPKRHVSWLCVGCSRATYCSRTCQRVDWRSSHRAECKVVQELRLSGKVTPAQHSDYQTAPLFIRQDIQKQVDIISEVWRRHGVADEPTIEMDYGTYPPLLSVSQVRDSCLISGRSRADVICVKAVLPNKERTRFVLVADKNTASVSEGSRLKRLVAILESSRNFFRFPRSDTGIDDVDWFRIPEN